MAFCQDDERIIREANYLIFEDVKEMTDEELLEVLAPFLGEINFAAYYNHGIIADLKEVDGAHTDKGADVRNTLAAIQKRARLRQGLLVMSFGDLYLSYGSVIMNKLGRTIGSLRSGSVRGAENSYPIEYIILYEN